MAGGLVGRLLVAVAVFLVAGEVLARALGVVDRLNGYNRLIYAPGPSADLPYVLRPGEGILFGAAVRVNRNGLRGPEITPTPAPGVRRVLVLGDSVVFGQGLPDDETLTAVLARDLGATGGARWEVLNGGVPGYDTVAEVRFLEAVGLALQPAIVVVGASLNDYDLAPSYAPTGILIRRALGARTPSLADRSELLTLLRWLVVYARGNLASQRAVRMANGPREAIDRLVEAEHLRFYHDPVPAYWNRLRAALAELSTLGERRGLTLLVAIFPEGYQVGRPAPDLTPQRRLLGACAEAHLRCLDLQPAFARAGGDLFRDVQHPNARGQAVAAAAIAAALSAGGDAGGIVLEPLDLAPHVAMVRDTGERIAVAHVGELVLVGAVDDLAPRHAEPVRHPDVSR